MGEPRGCAPCHQELALFLAWQEECVRTLLDLVHNHPTPPEGQPCAVQQAIAGLIAHAWAQAEQMPDLPDELLDGRRPAEWPLVPIAAVEAPGGERCA